MQNASRSCPICKRAAGARESNSAFPFCSRACRAVDLARWLDGSYRLAGSGAETAHDDERFGGDA